MFVRGYNAAMTANSTKEATSSQAPQSGHDNLFVGGDGAVGIANSADRLICAGGSATIFMVNQASDCRIKLGSSDAASISMDLDMDGLPDTQVGNQVISVGFNNEIKGQKADDIVLSLGEDNDVALGDGNDKVFVNGAGSTVNGESGDDIIMGAPKGLDYNELYKMDFMTMLATIFAHSAEILYTPVEKTDTQAQCVPESEAQCESEIEAECEPESEAQCEPESVAECESESEPESEAQC